MSYISNPNEQSNDLEKYLQHVVDLDLPLRDKYILIEVVRSILSHFVDQAFGVQTDQITLGSVGKMPFNGVLDDGTIFHHPDNQTADAQSDGAESDSNLKGSSQP